MYKFLTKHGQLLAILLGVLVVALFLGSVFSGLGAAGYGVGDDLNLILKNAKQAEGPVPAFDFFNPGLGATLALAAIAALSALLFGIWQLITSPKESMKGILGIVALLAIFFAFYSSADPGNVAKDLLDRFTINDNVSNLITGGIATTLVLLGGAFVIMILAEVRNLFK